MVLQPNVHCALGDICAVNTIRKIMDLRDKDKLFFLTKTHAAYISDPQQTNTLHNRSFLFHLKNTIISYYFTLYSDRMQWRERVYASSSPFSITCRVTQFHLNECFASYILIPYFTMELLLPWPGNPSSHFPSLSSLPPQCSSSVSATSCSSCTDCLPLPCHFCSHPPVSIED